MHLPNIFYHLVWKKATLRANRAARWPGREDVIAMTRSDTRDRDAGRDDREPASAGPRRDMMSPQGFGRVDSFGGVAPKDLHQQRIEAVFAAMNTPTPDGGLIAAAIELLELERLAGGRMQ